MFVEIHAEKLQLQKHVCDPPNSQYLFFGSRIEDASFNLNSLFWKKKVRTAYIEMLHLRRYCPFLSFKVLNYALAVDTRPFLKNGTEILISAMT